MKKISLFTALALMTIGIAACSQKSASDNITDKKEARKVNLRLGYWDEKQKSFMEELVQTYTMNNPNVSIELQATPYKGGEYWTKLEAAATGGSAPDIFWINVLHAEAYYEGGILADLTESAKEIELEANYPKSLIEAYKKEGKQIALPKDFDTNALWYNKEIFDKAGVAYPTDDWTWEDFIKAARDLKASDLAEGTYAVPAALDFQTFYYPTVFAKGGYIVKEDKAETGYEEEGTKAGIQMWIDLIDEGISPSLEVMQDTSPDAMFEAGNSAMILAGSYMTPQYMSNEVINKKIDLVEFPAVDGIEPNVINGLGYAVYEGSKNKEEAIEFVKWLAGKEAMEIQGKAGAVISARNDAQGYFTETNKNINLKAFTNHADKANPLPVTYNAAELYHLEANKLKLVYSREKELDEVLPELKKEADELIRR